MKIDIRPAALVLLFTAGVAAPAFAANVNTGYFGNVAIKGYDPVAYFTDGKPTKGSDAFTYAWEGAVWKFASERDRALFAAAPDAYAPQFGGLCAEGVAYHELSVNINPQSFRIIDGKLYLNYSAEFTDLPANIPAAVANWTAIKAALAK